VVRWARTLAHDAAAPKRALDVAIGRGRHAIVLAEAGFKVFGVDNRLEALQDAAARMHAAGYQLRAWCADLTVSPLPRARFELLLVTRYLQRNLFASLKDALTPGGVIIYETFTERQRAHDCGPTSPDHLLRSGELRTYFSDFDVLFDEEVDEPEALARIVARKR
jgi:SAM-dependent methyltransferase